MARELAILRRTDISLVAAFLVGITVALYSIACLAGVPFLAFVLGRFVHTLLSSARDRTIAARERWTGVAAAVGVLLHVALVVLAVWLVVYLSDFEQPFVAFAIGALAALVAAAAFGAALAPLAFTPFALGDGEPSVARALSRSFELGARFGPKRLARLGAGAGLRLAVGPVVMSFVALALSRDAALGAVVLAAPAGLALSIPFAGVLLASEYVAIEGEHERTPEAAVPRLRGIALLIAPGLLVVALTLIAASFTPAPMQPVPWSEPALRGIPRCEPIRPPGTTLTISATARGVRVEADDGGGAGEIDARVSGAVDCAIVVHEPGGHFAVFATGQSDPVFTIVDADGVRQDDGLGERVLDRLGTSGSALLALSGLLGALLTLLLARDVGAARTLDAPSLSARAAPGLAALECVLHTAGRTAVSKRALVVDDDAWLEADGGAVRLRLPPSVPIIGTVRAPKDGDAVVIVSRFDTPIVGGMRAAAQWPADARLVIGTRADAAEALVSGAARRATWLAVPALAFMLAAAVLVSTRL